MNTLCIELNKGEFLEKKIIRLEKGWKLRFIRGEGLYGKAVILRISGCDYETEFLEAQSIHELDSLIFREFDCDGCGSYRYEFFEDVASGQISGLGYFTVVPEWKIANEAKILSLNSLNVITHLAKLLGPMNEWEERLMPTKESGFNVLHLTPVQKLGISNSSYSIAEYDQLNPDFESDFAGLEEFIKKLEHEWHMLTVQDVVWNHCAKNANWLHAHPECAFNLHNSPHLRPAYVVDRALAQFSREIAEGRWEPKGLPPLISTESHLFILRQILKDEIFPAIGLHEFYQVNEAELFKKFANTAQEDDIFHHPGGNLESILESITVPIVQDPEFRRLNSTIDLDVFRRIAASAKCDNSNKCHLIEALLKNINEEVKRVTDDHIETAINAIIGHVSYERVAIEGPKKGEITHESPLVTEYFLQPTEYQAQNWEEDEKLAYNPKVSPFLMAFNGWIMNADPLTNFAEWPSQVYLRRELICWGDSVKLNYGRSAEDCPFLWEYMLKYTEQCARIFHGFRIDNCHSTPIHVAEHFLKAARRTRKDLYVVAELFTGSEEMDHIFVNRLGITSLIREAQNAPDSHEQGRFVYRYGGDPVGAFQYKSLRPAQSGVAHALFFDQTHDNPSPVQIRTAYDFLPTAAMCSISYCASGTVRGYDEFVPHNIDVVKERRLYRKWSEFGMKERGMVRARKLLNDLHFRLWSEGFTEIFVDQVDEDIVAVTRHHQKTHESVLLIAHTCFSESRFKWRPNCRPICVDDEIGAILFELKTVQKPADLKNDVSEGDTEKEEGRHITGLEDLHVECYENVPLDKSDAIEVSKNGKCQMVNFKLFVSGSVVVLKINPKPETVKACNSIEEIIVARGACEEVKRLAGQLSLPDFNYLLNRCEPEEMVESMSGEGARRRGAYEISNFGKLPYCGLQGVRPILQRIQERNDLGHPFCHNLRQGTWLEEFLIDRLGNRPALVPLARQMQQEFAHLANVPHHLRPCYFELLFTHFYTAIEEVLLDKIFANAKVPRIKITEYLCIASNAFLARISNALLPPLPGGNVPELSLSAGLPHFAEGIWRNWGRDTFIALPGTLLLTGRHREARDIILSFAGTLRHGLIPNLLAEGKAPRYNCRDAVWFWLVAIVRFAEMVEDGHQIFQEPVLRLYPNDESGYSEAEEGEGKVEPLHATMFAALCRHLEGIHFRERNAGPQIDEHMTDAGFTVSAGIERESGLVFGGNRWNCGTWMDKMGSSSRAGNRGEPATPRDGAAVELQGLALRVARALDKYSRQGVFPHPTIEGKGTAWTWAEWAARLEQSFGEHYFVAENCQEEFVNRKGILKDSFGSSLKFTDFQLRPNFCIALDAVPDIIAPEKAWSALKIAGDVLAANAPLGICTLDPEDWAYHGDYNNDDDGTEKSTAKGWNYHQGPEWLWVACAYLNAKLKVASRLSLQTEDRMPWTSTVEEVRARLFRFERTLRDSDWASLPELTNREGRPCSHSCPAQAWSIGYALETVDTLGKLMETMKEG